MAEAPGEPLAICIADRLLAKDRGSALGRAQAVRQRASRAGDILQADLFVAVCANITWRQRLPARAPTPEG